jgi:hypothetical protein
VLHGLAGPPVYVLCWYGNELEDSMEWWRRDMTTSTRRKKRVARPSNGVLPIVIAPEIKPKNE